ncbi:dihydropyrimidinase [Ensifer adhaerens]|uniref:dihydropyrimidinase n=1 Tax=Ensifer adhaerens TaxID=106592 RepID=UPI001CBC591A|nr:dihydropyrimidinase [Ensifer adhaerens]MBZ7924950.1 dihydropyrimidinase [Ensifer adhaerens]UAX95840.1 dihydropyrimidinase [Ensifer adhaerens]UAY04818.1 dihydropyrimidinase [Ensifer adhaerens]UAY10250.1 dihydropyrimidinase [Ensifer adhaerens]
MHDFVIKGGQVAIGDNLVESDIGIGHGFIRELGTDLSGRETIDATGLWVMPGGIDSHCHLDQPDWGSAQSADDFRSGSVSAAFGGITCMFPFAMPGPGMSTLDAFDRATGRAAGRSVIDYGLHGVVTGASASDLGSQFDRLVCEGVVSVKVFMTFGELFVGDDLFLDVLEAARARGMIVMVHAENDAAIRRTAQRLAESGRTGLRYHAVAHSEIMEREATHRAIALAEVTGGRIAVLHVSCIQAAEELVRGRVRGVDVVGETCPQYLFLTAADLNGDPTNAARFVFSPPPRTKASQEHLWAAMESGEIQLWSSDHSPYRLADKLPDPANPSFERAVSGIPGLETQMPLLFSEGLRTGRITLPRYLDLTARNAARWYGVDHVKGRIECGLHADLCLWDPDRKWTLAQSALRSNVDYTPYEGHVVTGKPVTVLVRGLPIIRDGVLTEAHGHGVYVARKTAAPSGFNRPVQDSTPWLD